MNDYQESIQCDQWPVLRTISSNEFWQVHSDEFWRVLHSIIRSLIKSSPYRSHISVIL